MDSSRPSSAMHIHLACLRLNCTLGCPPIQQLGLCRSQIFYLVGIHLRQVSRSRFSSGPGVPVKRTGGPIQLVPILCQRHNAQTAAQGVADASRFQMRLRPGAAGAGAVVAAASVETVMWQVQPSASVSTAPTAALVISSVATIVSMTALVMESVCTGGAVASLVGLVPTAPAH